MTETPPYAAGAVLGLCGAVAGRNGAGAGRLAGTGGAYGVGPGHAVRVGARAAGVHGRYSGKRVGGAAHPGADRAAVRRLAETVDRAAKDLGKA
jgi:hypothetical protein